MRRGQMEQRRAVTISGPISYSRTAFHCPKCRASHCPLDGEMGVSKGEKFTLRVRRAISFAAAGGSFGGAALAMRENFGLSIGHAQIGVMANEEGARIAVATEERERQWRDGERPPEQLCQTVVLLTDATSVLTRQGQEHKMVNLVRGYDLDDRATKTPGETPGGEEDQERLRPTLANSCFAGTAKEEACAGGEKSDLANRILAVAARLGVQQAKRVVFLADGNPTIWEIASELYPDGVHIQDFWHVMEYLSDAAKGATKTAQEEVLLRKKWADWLKESRHDDLLAELEEKRRKTRSKAKREKLRLAIGYIERGRERMDYASYIAEGLPIGSGPIEAACKHIVKERYDIAGARWSRENSGNVLALRLAIANGEWELYWHQKPAEQLKAA